MTGFQNEIIFFVEKENVTAYYSLNIEKEKCRLVDFFFLNTVVAPERKMS